MRPVPGTVAHWRELYGQDKFIYLLGVCPPRASEEGERADAEVLWFPISSQTKWTQIEPHRNEMVKIPRGTIADLHLDSYIQCFFKVERTRLDRFLDLDRQGYINWRACLPQYIPQIRDILTTSTLLEEYDCEDALSACGGA
jgi:hypothetical protein